jgi:hypothetical protein
MANDEKHQTRPAFGTEDESRSTATIAADEEYEHRAIRLERMYIFGATLP